MVSGAQDFFSHYAGVQETDSGCRRAAKIRLALDASIARTTTKPLAENGQENLEQSRNFCRLDRRRYTCIPISLVS
jgi:hypothetical protein